MIRRLLLLLLFISTSVCIKAQSAASFFPTQLGYKWHYITATLDSLQNIIPGSQYTQIDSFATEMFYQGKLAKVVLTLNSSLNDSSFISLEGSNAFVYVGPDTSSGSLLPGIGDSLQALVGWYSIYRFAQAVNQNYTLLSRTFNIPLDSNTTLPIIVNITGRRLSDQTVSVPFGTFANAKRFLITTNVSAQIFPSPFPPITLFSVPETTWIAQNTWIVKRVAPTVTLDLSMLGIPTFVLPGQITVLSTAPLSTVQSTPVEFELAQNYPNPFNPSTTITYRLSQASDVRLEVFDVLGRKVATLVQSRQGAGTYRVNFDASQFNLSSGLYFYRLTAGERSQTRRMILTK